jgi:hypothetical protein
MHQSLIHCIYMHLFGIVDKITIILDILSAHEGRAELLEIALKVELIKLTLVVERHFVVPRVLW